MNGVEKTRHTVSMETRLAFRFRDFVGTLLAFNVVAAIHGILLSLTNERGVYLTSIAVDQKRFEPLSFFNVKNTAVVRPSDEPPRRQLPAMPTP